MKKCAKCKVLKARREFVLFRRSSDGLYSYCKVCTAEKSRDWRKVNPDGPRKATKAGRAALRASVISAYGGRCRCCGESEPAFLVMDHVLDDGAAQRRAMRDTGNNMTYRRLRDLLPALDFTYQVLCWNCNAAKQYQPDGCPHRQPTAEKVGA